MKSAVGLGASGVSSLSACSGEEKFSGPEEMSISKGLRGVVNDGARHADDEEMNEELKAAIRWDDPMAAYMMKKQEEQEGGGSTKGRSAADGEGRGGGGPRRRVYQGPAPPNRYGIKPGWRWDGVDRGNGFEKGWFQARGKRSRTENLEYQWQMDE